MRWERIRGIRAFVAAGVAALGVVTLAPGARAEDAGADSGAGASCASSADCVAPLPHCEPTRHVCVECIGDRNCEAGQVCDVATGTCAACLSDADCSVDFPYCSHDLGKCVECVASKNCGDLGLACTGGQCGSCGDGICGPRELLSTAGFGFGGPQATASVATVCEKDCSSLCPTRDAKSKLGKFTFDGAMRSLYENICGPGKGPDATLQWTAAAAGTYFINATGPDTLSLSVMLGGCMGSPNQCSSGSSTIDVQVALQKGDTILVIADSEDVGPTSYTVTIADHGSAPSGGCSGPFCPSGPPVSGTPDGGAPSDQGKSLCVANAKDRGEGVCDGTRCACSHCPQDYDDAMIIPGAKEIRACMQKESCVGAACYSSGACRTVIDTWGGVSGPAFHAVNALQSCALTFACQLPCGSGADAGVTDGGVPVVDAGRLCDPGRKVFCACEGGANGSKVCAADGSGFGECACAPEPFTPVSASGCGCQIGGPVAPRGALLLAAVALGLAARRRRSRRDGAAEVRS
jgi:MYXO-CTERM domain-containing protein